ncbi:MAG: hypothetical protein Q8O29_14625 [Polaromonas sp.]|uniref:hypothetical protein n=1 Tax=Polaromonas sp. TaxID=1869339 RepID=UPI0027364567|nr:hypothetical protein [Polaromonas sp.]MDP2819470.1 hypothetical protein [Polaromonas sp.]
MWEWIRQNLNEMGVVFTVFAFLLSLIVLTMSAFRYVSVRRDELKNQRYERYHTLLRNISTGADGVGMLKLVSQRAFIYELRHFPEYDVLTKRLLESLLTEWNEDPEKSAKLTFEIQDTINAIK